MLKRCSFEKFQRRYERRITREDQEVFGDSVWYRERAVHRLEQTRPLREGNFSARRGASYDIRVGGVH